MRAALIAATAIAVTSAIACTDRSAPRSTAAAKSVVFVLIDALRRIALAGTELANAYCGTIRTRLLKIGARVRVSVRRVWVSLASSHPSERVFAQAVANLQRAGP